MEFRYRDPNTGANLKIAAVAGDTLLKRGVGDFLVFEKDLLTAPQEGFSYNLPCGVYFCGKKMN